MGEEEALHREQMEKLVREELERWDSSESTAGGDEIPPAVLGGGGGVGGRGGRGGMSRRPERNLRASQPSPLSGSNGTRPGSATSLSSMSGAV